MKTLKQISLVLMFACCALLTNAQILNCGINANWGYTINPNGTFVFTDSSTANTPWQITNHYWNFGDTTSNVSNLTNPSHYYSHPGNFTVCEYVIATYNNGGTNVTCIDTFCRQVSNCAGMVQAAFNYSTGANGVVVYTGTGSSNYPPLSFTWTFQNGSPSTSSTAVTTVQYNAPGTNQTCLIVTDANGCQATNCQNVGITTTACGSANANFTTTNSGNGVVALSSTSTGTTNNTLYQWWMDGQAITNPNPNTAYTLSGVNTGLHTFCLYLYANSNTFCDSTCTAVYVQNGVTPCGNMNASFTANSDPNGLVVLSSTSTNVPGGTWYQWWMDGSPVSVTSAGLANFSVSNVGAGTHQFCLYLYSPQNSQYFCDSACQYVVVQNGNPCAGLSAQFSDSISGNSGYFFGNSIPNTVNIWTVNGTPFATTQNASYNFASNPNTTTYVICHIVNLPGTTCSDTVCVPVIIPGGNSCNLNASFTQTNQGFVYTFSGNNANNLNYQQIWSVNGTNVGQGGSLTYTFAPSTTTADVCYTVYIPGTICVDTFCQNIIVQGGGGCTGFGATVTRAPNLNGGFDLTAVATGGTAPYAYLWNIGATTQTVQVNSAMTYCVTVYDQNQCSTVACDSSGVNPCNLQVTIAAQGNTLPLVLYSTVNGGTGPYTYYWGNGQSTSGILTITTPGTYCLSVFDANQCVGTACYTVGGTTNTDTICGVVFLDLNGNGVQDSTENSFGGGYIYVGNNVAYLDSDGHYQAVVPAGTYTIWYCAPSGYSFTIPINTLNPNSLSNNCASYTITTSGGSHCGFNFGIVNNNTTICGTVYFDADNDHTQDAGENGIANVHVYITGGGATYHAYTDQNGDYCILVPIGTYTVTIGSNYLGGTVTPTSISLVITNTGTVNGNNDFGIYTPPGSCNLSLNITPHTTITPGFPAWYDIEVCNIGGNITSGTVNMFYDNSLQFTHSSPTQTSHNASTHTLSWALANLLPGQCEYYWVNFDALTSINIGQFAFTLANVITSGCQDINMANNVDTIHQNVTGSWDPNNKLAYVTNHEANPNYQEISSMNANQRIEYVINFQNTGNAPAINVVVKDLISTDLDMSSFELLGASHPMTATVNGNDINFKFNAIMLPDSNSNEAESHGFVKFAVNAVNGLLPGHVISDVADIYFDYNAAVTTNDAAVILLGTTGIDETTANTTVVVAPNPMSQYAEFRLSGGNNTGFTLRVTDMTGRLVREETTANNRMVFDRSNLAAGVYTYQIVQQNKLSAKGKLVVQ